MANEDCPTTIMQTGSLMETVLKAANYNEVKCFDSSHRVNQRVKASLERNKNVLKLKVAIGVLDNQIEEEPAFAGLYERMTTINFNMSPKGYGFTVSTDTKVNEYMEALFLDILKKYKDYTEGKPVNWPSSMKTFKPFLKKEPMCSFIDLRPEAKINREQFDRWSDHRKETVNKAMVALRQEMILYPKILENLLEFMRMRYGCPLLPADGLDEAEDTEESDDGELVGFKQEDDDDDLPPGGGGGITDEFMMHEGAAFVKQEKKKEIKKEDKAVFSLRAKMAAKSSSSSSSTGTTKKK